MRRESTEMSYRHRSAAYCGDKLTFSLVVNPVPEEQWDYTYSIKMIRQLMGSRMYPLTLEGLDRAMRELVR